MTEPTSPSTSDAGDPLDAARRRAVDALAGRDLLAAELDRILARAGHDARVAAQVRTELIERGLLDADRTARERVRRWRAVGRSEADIRARLRAAGLDDARLERVLSSERDDHEIGDHDPELTAAVEAVRRRGRDVEASTPDGLRRLAARLGRAGFDPDTIRRALRHCGFDDAPLDHDA